jgi:hypothetical protein
LNLLQIYETKPTFLFNTQSKNADCLVQLTANDKNYNDNKWQRLVTYRDGIFSSIKTNSYYQNNTNNKCTNQILSDIDGVYIGGIPSLNNHFITRDESKLTDSQKVQRYNFRGCLKTISTLLRMNKDINSNETDFKSFNLSEANVSPGENNAINLLDGCPIEEGLEKLSLWFLGNGYIFFDLTQTFPIEFQPSKSFDLSISFKSEWNNGVLFLSNDIVNLQYIIIRLVNLKSIEIIFKSKINYNSANNPLIKQKFIINFNRTFSMNQSLTPNEWTTLRISFDFVNHSLSIIRNGVVLNKTSYLTTDSVSSDIYNQLALLNLSFDFYLDPKIYFGGHNLEQAQSTLNILRQNPRLADVLSFFLQFFNYIIYLNTKYQLHFSGCLKDLKINNFYVDTDNRKNEIDYQNVRFDGCPRLNLKLNEYSPTDQHETIYEGYESIGYDTDFKSFTEYFYRIVAFNSQGSSESNWFLFRSPASAPTRPATVGYLNAKVIGGYKIYIETIKYYCFYCDSSNRMNQVFTGIMESFILDINQFDLESYQYNKETRRIEFKCEKLCLNNLFSKKKSKLEFRTFEESSSKTIESGSLYNIYILTKPVTKYSLSISLCTSDSGSGGSGGGCIKSNDSIYIQTLEEAPTGILPPKISLATSSALYLNWTEPEASNGNLTGYILRISILNNKTVGERVVYFGLLKQYNITEGLEPFTQYSFTLEVCNRIGCTRSIPVIFETLENAPVNVQAPIVLSVTFDSVIIKWLKPSVISNRNVTNVMTAYFLYLNVNYPNSNLSDSFIINATQCTYCDSNIYRLNDLKPGSNYSLILSACNTGGCTNSTQPLLFETLEISPNVSDVLITALTNTGSLLTVHWNEPSEMNGKLIKYILYEYKNGSDSETIIYTGLDNKFTLKNLKANQILYFIVACCNSYACSLTEPKLIKTSELSPIGCIILQGNATGPNEIVLNWFSSKNDPFIPNGNNIF